MKVDLGIFQTISNNEVESIELVNGEFINSEDEHRVLAYNLLNGDVFTVNGSNDLQFYDGIIYEVEFNGYDFVIGGIGMNTRWKRTGVSYTMDEFNIKFNK